ncbi:MAG: aspartyl protease family protein [Bacteroidetes bacterium]|nr:aspartyl protease family protein [Bacteroidota bacterium]
MKTVRALWDTGATGSVVTASMAKELDLVPIDQMETTGVHGTKRVNVYAIDLRLPNDVTVLGMTVSEADGPTHDFDVIIGMDVITLGDFAVSNYQGQTVFSFRYPSQGHIDFVKEGERSRIKLFRKKKIGRNEPILVRHPDTGETKTVKSKHLGKAKAEGWMEVE